MAEHIQIVNTADAQQPTTGTMGLKTQLPGLSTTVSGMAASTGGIGTGNLIQTDTK